MVVEVNQRDYEMINKIFNSYAYFSDYCLILTVFLLKIG